MRMATLVRNVFTQKVVSMRFAPEHITRHVKPGTKLSRWDTGNYYGRFRLSGLPFSALEDGKDE